MLFFVDNIYRYTLAGTEVSALLGRMPSAVGYQPTLAEEMGVLQGASPRPRPARSPRSRRVRARGRPTDPSPATTTFAHLDATVVLSRQIAALGIYPAVDPLDSTSRQLDPLVVGEEHYNVARGVQADAAALLGNCGTSSRSSAWTSCRKTDKLTVFRARKIQRFLSQPFNVAGSSPARGKIVSLKDTIRGFKGHHRGRVRQPARRAFYMVGSIDRPSKAKTLQSRQRRGIGRPMAESTIHVDIVSAEGEIFAGGATMVFVPASQGEIGGAAARHC